jgi:hypothetical protein
LIPAKLDTPPGIPLGRAKRKAAHELLLQQDIDDQRRDSRDQGGRRDHVLVRDERPCRFAKAAVIGRLFPVETSMTAEKKSL